MSAKPPVDVRVTRSFDAAPERVFDAWLDTEMIGQWMFGPGLRDEEIVRLSINARVGRSFSFLVRRQGQEIDHIGQYRAIERPKRLAFTWGIAGESDGESLVIIDIVAADSGEAGERGCGLTLTHQMDPKWAEYASRTEAAWTKMLDALAKALS